MPAQGPVGVMMAVVFAATPSDEKSPSNDLSLEEVKTSHTHTHTHTHTHIHIYTNIHTNRTHTHTHTYIHTYTHTHTHTQRNSLFPTSLRELLCDGMKMQSMRVVG